MKKLSAITLLYLLVCFIPGVKAQSYSKAINALDASAQQGSSASDLEPERKKRAKGQAALKIRYRIFGINLVRFNKKIRANYDKEKKSLERYENRLKRKKARQDKRKGDKKSDFQYRIKKRGPAVRQRKIL